jgi:hypothetical protein
VKVFFVAIPERILGSGIDRGDKDNACAAKRWLCNKANAATKKEGSIVCRLNNIEMLQTRHFVLKCRSYYESAETSHMLNKVQYHFKAFVLFITISSQPLFILQVKRQQEEEGNFA